MKINAQTIIDLYIEKGDLQYVGEGVSQLEHAWQCGNLAKESGASQYLQLASWLHDFGHLISKKEGTPTLYGHDDRHEVIGSKYLESLFPSEVTEPISLHVLAKRYLVTTDSFYKNKLSPDSIRSLNLQGGDMSAEECEKFERHSFSNDAISLRRWDDLGKMNDWIMPNKQLVIDELFELSKNCAR